MTLSCSLLNVIAGLTFGYSAHGIDGAASVLWRCWYGLEAANAHNDWLVGSLLAAVSIGFIPAALVAGLLADTLGRRRMVLGAAAIASCSILSGFSSSHQMQMAARLVTGAGMGVLTATCPVYTSEVAPAERRGRIASLFPVACALGVLLGSVAGYLVLGEKRDADPVAYCRALPQDTAGPLLLWLVSPGAALGLVLMGLVHFRLPESTVWIKARGNSGHGEVSEVHSLIHRSGGTTAESDEPGVQPRWRGLAQVPQAMVLGLVLAAAFALTGGNAITALSPRFMQLGGTRRTMQGSCLLMLWNLVMTFVAFELVDRIGRRMLLLLSLLGMTISLVAIHPVREFLPDPYLEPASLALLLLFAGSLAGGPGTLFWVVGPEVLPKETTALGFGLINAVQCGFGLATTLSIPALDQWLGTKVFLGLGLLSLLLFFYVLVCLPETQVSADLPLP